MVDYSRIAGGVNNLQHGSAEPSRRGAPAASSGLLVAARDGIKVYGTDSGTFVAADGAGWIEGVSETTVEATFDAARRVLDSWS